MFKRVPRAEVEWVDSTAHQGWYEHEELLRDVVGSPLICLSVGFLVQDSRSGVVLVQSINDKQYGEAIVIPREVIRRVTFLVEEEEKGASR